MKKLKLEALGISAGAPLTREQLRNVVGGSVGTHCAYDIDCGQYGVICTNNICTYATGTGIIDCRNTGCPQYERCDPYSNMCTPM